MPAFAVPTESLATLDAATGVILVGVLIVAGDIDIRSGRIPNGLSLGAAGLGLILALVSGGLQGGLASLWGWLLGAGLFFAFFALGVMGAGDVKLLAAVGALKGAGFVLNAFVFTGLAGGAIAVAVVLRRRKVAYMVASVTAMIQTLVYTGSILRPKDPKSSPLRFPYGLAIAAGSIAAMFWRL